MLPEKYQQYIFYFVQSYDAVLLKGRRAHAIPKHLAVLTKIAELIEKLLMWVHVCYQHKQAQSVYSERQQNSQHVAIYKALGTLHKCTASRTLLADAALWTNRVHSHCAVITCFKFRPGLWVFPVVFPTWRCFLWIIILGFVICVDFGGSCCAVVTLCLRRRRWMTNCC